MKDQNSYLKLQAYLDGELTAAEVRHVETLLNSDQELQVMLNELRNTKTVLMRNEPVTQLPVNKDFYWSQIQKAIASEARVAARKPYATAGWLIRLRRVLLPLSSLAVVLAMSLTVARFFQDSGDNYYVEIENVSEETTTSSFRAQSEKMFVVWVSNREIENPDADEYENEFGYQ